MKKAIHVNEQLHSRIKSYCNARGLQLSYMIEDILSKGIANAERNGFELLPITRPVFTPSYKPKSSQPSENTQQLEDIAD